MKRILALLLLCLNAACMTNPNTSIEAVAPAAIRPSGNQAVVVMGVSVSNPARSEMFGKASGGGGSWIAFDPLTGLRNNAVLFTPGVSCDLLGHCDGIGTMLYKTFVLAPGSYAMAYTASSQGVFYTVDRADGQPWTPCVAYSFEEPFKTARPQTLAPSFAVQAGEVVYVGNLTFDFSRHSWAGWSFSLDQAEARAALAPSGLADHLITRPMLRIDGTPINPVDGAPSLIDHCHREMPIVELLK
jgi:hypothetical protein